jgi:hypothetical protein
MEPEASFRWRTRRVILTELLMEDARAKIERKK